MTGSQKGFRGLQFEVLKKRGERPFQVNFSSDRSDVTFELLVRIYKIKKLYL